MLRFVCVHIISECKIVLMLSSFSFKQGQPSGEAFIQMDSEESARLCAQRKHNQFMVFGKKYRYIEVFQCSGDDMNMVLNGGLQSPVTPHHPHLPGAGKQPSLLSPGMLAQPPPSTAQALSTHTHVHAHPQSLTHSHSPHHSHPALQSNPSVAAAVAALAQHQQQQQQQHSHMSLIAGNSPQMTAVSSLSPYLTTTTPPSVSAHTTHPSLVAAQSAAVGVPQTHLQLNSPTTASTVGNQQMAMTSLPFNFSLPPPQSSAAANSALLAQQQAQFIAQHNLLARQQAAAAAVEQQQQQFYANIMNPIFMSHPAAAAAAAAAMSPNSGMTFGGNPHGGASAAAAASQPQFVLMPRPYFQPFPISYMPQGYQYAGNPGAAAAAAAAATAAAGGLSTGGSTGMHSAASAGLQHSMKRSYDNAFQQQDPNSTVAAVGAAKRALTRPPPGTLYSFYNPGV